MRTTTIGCKMIWLAAVLLFLLLDPFHLHVEVTALLVPQPKLQQRQPILQQSQIRSLAATPQQQEEQEHPDDDETQSDTSRFSSWKMPFHRRDFCIHALASSLVVATTPVPAWASTPKYATRQNALDAVAEELTGPVSQLAQLERAVETQDYTRLLELTKQMDQTLRKQVLSPTKPFLTAQVYATLDTNPTQICNNVTFDLIGINKFSRPGQEEADMVQYHAKSLRSNVQILYDWLQESQTLEDQLLVEEQPLL